MRKTVLLGALAAVNATFTTEHAPVVHGNPIDVIYTATLPKEPFFQAPGLSGNVKGFISASAPPDGVGVRFTIRFENLPKTGGPFSYHLHVNKAIGGNCTSTGAHLDPTKRGEKPPCEAGKKSSCQVGDLAGKHGKIHSDPFIAEYVDKFASLKEGDPAFFGSRSFVIHLANSTRITCANFVKDEPSFPSASPTGKITTSTALRNGTASTSIPVTSSSTRTTAVLSTTTSLPSNDGGNDRSTTGSSDKPTHVSLTPVLPPTGTSASGNGSIPSLTVPIAAAGSVTPTSMACWMLVAALFIGVL